MVLLKKIVQISVTVFAVTLFFACESNFKEIQKINVSEFMPTGEADSVNMKYTDSGKIKAILKGPKMFDYGTAQYPFTEFPKGIDVTLYDQNGKRNYIQSNYAITFNFSSFQ